MAKYSIITPIYNDANYLPVCIHSIACQEYPDIESILIDDGSTDGSLELCKSMTGANPRFKVVSSSHGGVSHARNIGLNLATGDYVIFLDSDDYLQADAIIIIDREIKDMECDLVLFDFIKEYSNGKNDLSSKKLPLKKVMDAEELSQTYLNDFIVSNQVFSVLWDKAYKRVSIGSIRFDETVDFSEDWYFAAQVMKNAQRAIYLNHCLYHYRIHSNRLSSKKRKSFFRDNILWEYNKKQELCLRFNLHFQEATYRLFLFRIFTCLLNEYGIDRSFKRSKENILEYVSHPVTRELIRNINAASMKKLSHRFMFLLVSRKWSLLLSIISSVYSKAYRNTP
jgi:glycosyltransferase involved in cell wall biosynthesis